MSKHQELVSAKYIEDQVVLDESRSMKSGPAFRTRSDCNRSAEGFMVWGFFAVAMCAIGIITRSTM